jgi:murein DD-endopeptidase MepM/ murein hydrolase activator NlpD
MRFLLITAALVALPSYACKYLAPKGCASGETCVYVEPGKTECRRLEGPTDFVVASPFDAKTKASCDQGNLSADGNSHRFHNTAFALDLQTQKDASPAVLLAGMDGVVQSFGKCQTANDGCGMGFGNHVRLFADNGVVLLYAHLDRVDVSSGQRVKVGQVLGLEGNTGATGQNNRHLHLSAHYDWRLQGLEFWKPDAWLPESIPFRLEFQGQLLDSRKVPCRR